MDIVARDGLARQLRWKTKNGELASPGLLFLDPNLVSAVWKTEDRISTVATAAGERAGTEAARKVVKEEIGPVITAAVMSAVKPIGDRVIEHIAMDDERQKATDKEVLILRSIEARRAARGTR